MTYVLADEIAVQRAYDSVKARVIAHDFEPGEHLKITQLAEQLHVSTTPVREALSRLAAERLIAVAPRMGFFTKHISEKELCDLYELNSLLLDRSLRARRREPVAGTTFHLPSLTAVNDPPRSEPSAVHTLVPILGSLFEHIATRSGNGEIVRLVQNINDGLHYVRVCESKLVEDPAEEVSKLCQLYYRERHDDLRDALVAYHDKRLALLPLLFTTFML